MNLIVNGSGSKEGDLRTTTTLAVQVAFPAGFSARHEYTPTSLGSALTIVKVHVPVAVSKCITCLGVGLNGTLSLSQMISGCGAPVRWNKMNDGLKYIFEESD